MTAFPESDRTTLTVRLKRPVAFELRFRVPRWAREAVVRVNDSELKVATQPGTWATIARTWQPGDRVTIRMPMELALKPVDAQNPSRVAAVYGPVVLVQEHETITAPDRNDPSKWIKPRGGPLEFHSEQYSTATFVPFYRVGYNFSYRIYFDVVAWGAFSRSWIWYLEATAQPGTPRSGQRSNCGSQSRARHTRGRTLDGWAVDRHMGGSHPRPLPHHRAYGSVHDGSSWLRGRPIATC
jgi:hypothetical protein